MVFNGQEIPLKEGTYIHELIMDRAKNFIRENASKKRPFFCYIPTAIPHAAMHAPKEIHDKWRKKFPQFDNVIGKYKAGEEDCPDVVNPIAGFAAMMEVLDTDVGDILDLLKELGIDENTIVMFSSDNGAHKEGGHDPLFWNSTGSLRGHKRDMHEGGIRTPMLTRWPAEIKAGRKTQHLSAFWDIVPTMAEIIGQPVPEKVDGISFLPTLKGKKSQKNHEFLYWEFTKGDDQIIFSQSVRSGKWKLYKQVKQPVELFDLDKDPYEQNDLAKKHPEIVERMESYIKKAHVPLPSQKEG
jgi:arylsulfatase A-like enzyme